MTDWAWRDAESRAEVLRTNRKLRVARRAARLLEAYKQLQREATILLLMKARRVAKGREGGDEAVKVMTAWCRDNTCGADGLDIPGTRAPAPGAFMRAMAEAKGGMVTGPTWGRLVLPERHQDVMAREREMRGQCKR